jgi:hypothetical protein
MRVPDLYRDCVGFLYVEVPWEAKTVRSYRGTAFFVTLKEPTSKELTGGEEIPHVYLVTARHCVQKAEKHGGLFVRYSDNNRSTQTARLPRAADWEYPEDPSVDVAVVPFALGRHVVRAALVESVLATRDQLAELHVGPGDDVVIIGLFTQRAGKGQNLPIVRSGVIAAMPEEKLFDPTTGQLFESYLVEVRSMGGLSGSPVFVSIGYSRAPDGKINDQGRHYIIGLVRGHWSLKEQAESTDYLTDFDQDSENVNMGIATVTPIREVLDVLWGPRLSRLRKESEAPPQSGTHLEDTVYVSALPAHPNPRRRL